MGWFWSTESVSASPITLPETTSQPGNFQTACPISKSSSLSPPTRNPRDDLSTPNPSTPNSSTSCPYAPPISTTASSTTSSATPDQKPQTWASKINPLNLMPSLPNAPTSPTQSFTLPLEREASSIPRGPLQGNPEQQAGGCPVKHVQSSSSSRPAPEDVYKDSGSDKWQYPSPQQMYNALLRKGYTDTDPTAVPAMVSVHNFLNEGAWAEILEWERRFHSGLATGWRVSARGEENSCFGAMMELEANGWRRSLRDTRVQMEILDQLKQGSAMEDTPEPRLLRFEGRPQDRTPKSRVLEMLGRVLPGTFSASPPFDRHDWYVLRHSPDGRTKEIRYVIDYYSGPDESTKEPVFYLDVRPAIDGPVSLSERLLRWSGDLWFRSTGGAVRERNQLEAKVNELRELRGSGRREQQRT